MNKEYLCVWDFDSPLYKSAVLLQNSYIEVIHKGSGRIKKFKNKTEFWGNFRLEDKIGGWLLEQNEKVKIPFKKSDFEIIDKYEIRLGDKKGFEILEEQINALKRKDWFGSLKLVIAGNSGNYRYDIFKDYKANRTKPKPLRLKAMREWLIKEYKKEVTLAEGCESDDYISIMGWWHFDKLKKDKNFDNYNLVLVGIDKDLWTVPALFYNPDKKMENPIWNSELKAAKSFFTQLLCGDTSDNIKGLESVSDEVWDKYHLRGKERGVGIKNALTLLSDCSTIKQMEERVLSLYKEFYEDDWKSKFQLSYQLLKLQEKKGVIPKYKFKE